MSAYLTLFLRGMERSTPGFFVKFRFFLCSYLDKNKLTEVSPEAFSELRNMKYL